MNSQLKLTVASFFKALAAQRGLRFLNFLRALHGKRP